VVGPSGCPYREQVAESEQSGAVVVQTVEGGCGGTRREERVVPGSTGARTTRMGQLEVLAGEEVISVFPPGSYVSWRTT
jgi:hypothetical protein